MIWQFGSDSAVHPLHLLYEAMTHSLFLSMHLSLYLPACSQASGEWSDFSEQSASLAFSSDDGGAGALRRLIAEQEDEFCGPKPIRPPADEMPDASGGLAAAMSGGLGGLGGGMMSGRDILALLQGMSLGGGSLS